MIWIKRLLHRIWAYLPILALTDDTNYLVGECSQEKPPQYYLSVVNILFGEKKIQFFSFPIRQPNACFLLFRIVRLSNVDNFQLSEMKVKDLEKKYKDHFDLLSEEDRHIERDSLRQHLSDEKARIETSYNKINAFTTIIIAIIPIAIAFVDVNTIKALGFIGWGIFLLLIYATVNLCAWIFQAIDVRTFMSSSFKDLKESEEKGKEYNWQIYYDWQQTKRKADMYVSFVRYTKKWIITVIILTIIFSVGIPFIEEETMSNKKDDVYTIEINRIEETYEKSAIYWNLVMAELHRKETNSIIILYNDTTDVKNINYIKEELKQFVNLSPVWLKDDTLEDNEVKIILGESK